MEGKLVILSGPSGVGKDTVIDAWRAQNPRVERVVACTTREPRVGESDGVDYHFLSVPEFHRIAENGGFLEHKLVHGNWYATPLAALEKMLAEGKIAILKIDVQGGLEVMQKRPDAVSIFVLPPSLEELERRIRSRATDSPEKIRIRLENALGEIQAGMAYRHHVVNGDLQETVRALAALC